MLQALGASASSNRNGAALFMVAWVVPPPEWAHDILTLTARQC